MSICIQDKRYSPAGEIVVDFLIMDHLTQEEHTFVRIFLKRFVTYLDGVFHAIAESKVPGDIKFNRAKIENRRCEVLLPKIIQSSGLFDSASNCRPVVRWNLKFLDNESL
jgi:hypothetical protein